MNAGGLVSFSAGVTAITAGPLQYTKLAGGPLGWLLLTGFVIFTTVHAQDFPDIEGDAARGRATMPLLYGQTASRISLAVGVLVWSVVCPAYWQLGLLGYLLPITVGGMQAVITCFYRSQVADEIVWKLWCGWFGIIYLLPLFS